MKKIGILQTRGIGDILIALPIAQFYLSRGCEVVWPIDSNFIDFFRDAEPRVKFLPVKSKKSSAEYFYLEPLALLQKESVDEIFELYNSMTEMKVSNESLSRYLKFDEYKYAIARVPFSEKWSLQIKRNHRREIDLFSRLEIDAPYICIHCDGSNFSVDSEKLIPDIWRQNYKIIRVNMMTDNPFDWIYTLERAAKLVMIDSCYANLVDQLGLQVEKYFICRTPNPFTPVLREHWSFITL